MAEPEQSGPWRRTIALSRDRRTRSLAIQIVLLIIVVWFGWSLAENARQNLAARQIATGFGFLNSTAGFGITQSLIGYAESDTYGRAFLVGLLNTLLVAGLGIICATIIGFLVGLGRLSPNILLSRLAEVYVEIMRNLPLLFQILFWYLAVLGVLPGPRQSTPILGTIYFSNRGAMFPRPVFEEGSGLVGAALLLAIALSIGIHVWARRRLAATGEAVTAGRYVVALIVGLPLAAYFAADAPISLEAPELAGFNFTGGIRVIPEFVALLLALSTYTGAFIAEIVRAGVLAVGRGQAEAANSLGLPRGLTLRLIIVPQALRLVIPPLTNQYLNLTKNSSLAVAIGYPDFFAVFAGTTLNQTGQAIEIIALTMAVYLLISLVTAALMNWYNRSIALKGAGAK